MRTKGRVSIVADLLMEVGTEEMPASAVYGAMAQVEQALPQLLERARLDFEEVRVMATPRRLAAIVTGVAGKARSQVHRRKGPPAGRAREADGSWSKAALGFAQSQGMEPDRLTIEDTGKGSYLFVVTESEGRDAIELLPGVLSELVASLRFGKSMRWGSGEERFSRPVRWLVGLLDDRVVPFEFAGLVASDVTWGHRYLSSGAVVLESVSSYESTLEDARVVADNRRRREVIIESARGISGEAGMVPLLDEEVLEEVVQLVEWPGVVLGRFDERYLSLPREVLVHAMEEHQRCFPVEDGGGNIEAGFLAVHNGDPGKEDIIRKGHERVLAARLADAEFFFNEDIKRPLSDRAAELEHVVYQSVLGSMAEKSERLERLVETVGMELGLDIEVVERARRAAVLAKCDLVTHVVVEFTSLQGTMGSIYALRDGEDARAAAAVAEQYMPRRQGDRLPETIEGSLLSLAEKADNLASSFGLGHVPTGSEDPYALRRQALGMLLVMIEQGLSTSVSSVVRASAESLEAEAHGFAWTPEAEGHFREFFTGRERVFFTERGYRYDLVDAVLKVDWDRPLSARDRLAALDEARRDGLLARLYTAFERCHNLSRGHDEMEVDEALMSEEAEREVFRVLIGVEEKAGAALDGGDYRGALAAMEALCFPVDRLFDDVLIMAEDVAVRSNRLSLLRRTDALLNRVASFESLTWD